MPIETNGHDEDHLDVEFAMVDGSLHITLGHDNFVFDEVAAESLYEFLNRYFGKVQ